MLYTSTLWNNSGESFALLLLNKLVMMNKVYELPVVASEMCKGCPIPPASESVTASLCTSCLL